MTTVPASPGGSHHATRRASREMAAPSPGGSDHLALLEAAAAHPEVSDKALRLFVTCVARFGDVEFTAEQAAAEAGLPIQAVWQLLGETLRPLRLVTSRKATVGYTATGSRRRMMKYRIGGGE